MSSPRTQAPTAAPKRRRLSPEARREIIERAATELFAERGYHGTAIDDIAARSGVTPPVVYQHFHSKQDLHRRLLERHFAEMRASWRGSLLGEGSAEERITGALDAWFSYVESHPYAWRMLFRETTGDAEADTIHRQAATHSRSLLLPLIAQQKGIEKVAGSEPEAIEMTWEILRGALRSLAFWWYEHQHIPRERIVSAAMNVLWRGLQRLSEGR